VTVVLVLVLVLVLASVALAWAAPLLLASEEIATSTASKCCLGDW
jgi:hypothetical protein